MKQIAGNIAAFLFVFSVNAISRQVTEKQLTFFPKSQLMYAYDIRYDAKIGSYAYTDYDKYNFI